MTALSLAGVRKSYGQHEVIPGVDLDVNEGEFVVFVGPSGCGKSTLLRMIAGLEEISGGDLTIGGKRMNDVAPAKRGVSLVFQSYALYPHMTVEGNMSFAMRLARQTRQVITEKVGAAAEILQIRPYLDRLPKALSGGQKQRVAIGRAFVREPAVFLFDEPLSNLDAALRVKTRIEIARLHQKLDATMVYVTHDQVEAMTLADRIVVLRDGRVEQIGTPLDLYHRPANLFVAGFIGSPKMNFLPLATGNDGLLRLDDELGGASLPLAGAGSTLGIRPEHLHLDPEGPILARVDLKEHLGEYVLVHLTAGQHELSMKLFEDDSARPGDAVRLGFIRDRAHLFDETGCSVALNAAGV